MTQQRPCGECGKTFRTPVGAKWHKDHFHQKGWERCSHCKGWSNVPVYDPSGRTETPQLVCPTCAEMLAIPLGAVEYAEPTLKRDMPRRHISCLESMRREPVNAY